MVNEVILSFISAISAPKTQNFDIVTITVRPRDRPILFLPFGRSWVVTVPSDIFHLILILPCNCYDNINFWYCGGVGRWGFRTLFQLDRMISPSKISQPVGSGLQFNSLKTSQKLCLFLGISRSLVQFRR